MKGIKGKVATVAAGLFIVAGLAGLVRTAEIVWLGPDSAQVEQDRGGITGQDMAAVCLSWLEGHPELPRNACQPFTQQAWEGMTVADSDAVDGWSYDAMADGTMVKLPDGTLLWVPRDPKLCPRVTLADTLAGLCASWEDMGTDDY